MAWLSRLGKTIVSVSIIILATVGAVWWYMTPAKSSKAYDLEAVLSLKNIVPVAVIGSGPAGLSAALYGSRARLHTVVFQGPQAGGQLMGTTHVENWPGVGKKQGPDIMNDLRGYVQEFGAILVSETVKSVDFASWPFTLTLADGSAVHALSVIMATGAAPVKLDVPGESAYWGKGVTGCAVCDAAFFKDKDVVVVGGGDSAIEQALQLSAYARNITILVRGEKMRASAAMQDRLKTLDFIKIIHKTRIKEVQGDGNKVTGIQVVTDGREYLMPIDGVFLAIGHNPNTELVKGHLDLTGLGYVHLANRSQQTSREGVFAAGDVADDRYRQAGVASGDGIKAALDAESFLYKIGFDEVFAKSIERNLYEPEVDQQIEIASIESAEQFKELVLESKVPVLVDFYTEFCPSCLQMLPAVKAVAAQFAGKLLCVKVDTNKVPEVKDRYEVSSVPCLLVIKHGLVIARYNDALSKRELRDLAQRFVEEHA